MKLKTFTCLVLICLIFQVSISFGQAVIIDNEMDKKYTPNQSSLFNNLIKKSNDNSSSSTTEITFSNTIRFTPTMLFRQKVFVTYDRKLYDGLALSLGIGKSFGIDYFQNLNIDIQDFNTTNNALNASEIVNQLNSTLDGGSPLLHASLKVYFRGTAFSESYMEFGYRYERLDYTLNPTVNSIKVEGRATASFKMSALSFGYGYSWAGGSSGKITHDFYINTGIKFFNYTSFDKFHIGTGSQHSDYVYRAGVVDLSFKIIPSINMGYAFGFGF